MENGTKVEVRTIDGNEFLGTVVKDGENKFPEYLLLSSVWITKPGWCAAAKEFAFIMTRNIVYITNV